MYQLKVSRSPLLGFVSCYKTLLDKEENLPNTRTGEGFDPNACKLMEKVDYDFNNPVSLGKGVEVEINGLNKIQKKIQAQ